MTNNARYLKELEDIEKPSALFSLIFTNKGKTTLQGLEKFKNLIELDLSGNSLSLPVEDMLHLRFLKKLNLSRNEISLLWDLPKSIEQLNLSGNLLTTLKGVATSLASLHTLDISSNKISSLMPLTVLSNLQCLYASKNCISDLSPIEECGALIEVDLASNFIESSQSGFISKNTSICAIGLKDNPLMREIRELDSQISGFSEQFEGVFFRNYDKLKEFKYRKLKFVSKKAKKDEKGLNKKSYGSSSRKSSMQAIYEQVISEDPEMEESMNSSESEEKLVLNEEFTKKPSLSIAKLQLEKITEKPNDKISCEKWSTKPESSIELLFEELIHHCKLDDLLDKGLSSGNKYEHLVSILKQREDQRKAQMAENEELRERIRELQNKAKKHKKKISLISKNVESKQLQLDKITEKNQELTTLLTRNENELDYSREEFLIREAKYQERIKTLEDENKNSSRFNFSNSFESDTYLSECSLIEMQKSRNNYEALVPNDVAAYINQLLTKIKHLASKTKKLRLQREMFRYRANTLSQNIA